MLGFKHLWEEKVPWFQRRSAGLGCKVPIFQGVLNLWCIIVVAVVTKGNITARTHNRFVRSPAVREAAAVGDSRLLDVCAEIPEGT